jgi:hypothetical protein
MIISSVLSCLIQISALAYVYVHPLHVSVTEIEFDQKSKALEITMRVFIDDLELTLRNNLNHPELDLLNPGNGVSVDQMVRDYLKDHFRISLDNTPQKINYLGHEKESDAFIFYIEVTNVKKWKTISIHNDILMETHDDQSNLVHVTVNNKVKSLRLTKDTPANKLSFELGKVK